MKVHSSIICNSQEAETPVPTKPWTVVLAAQSCLTLCNPTDCSPPGSSVRGILQARILQWVAIPFSGGSSWHRDGTWVSCTAGRFFTIWATGKSLIDEWRNQTQYYLWHHIIILSHVKEWSVDRSCNMGETRKHAKWDTKGYVLWFLLYEIYRYVNP